MTCLASLLAVATTAHAQQIYLAESGTNSQLYIINPTTAQATPVGNIGFGVGAMAFSPTSGRLYGVTAPAGAGVRQLIEINPLTGAATVIGSVGRGNFGISDLAFRADGTLFAWSENSDDLITININTGAGTIVANAAISTFGSALAFNASGTLYLAGNGSSGPLRTVNPATGLTTIVVAALTGSPKPGYPIPAMKFHPASGVLYAINKIRFPAEVGGSAHNLVTIDPTTGVITNIGATLPRADALAIGSPPPPAPPTAFPPTFVTPPTDQTINQNGSVTVPFRITGAVIASALRVSLDSSNRTLLPVGLSTLTSSCGSDGSCTLRITPENGRAGTSVVTISLTDGFFTTTTSFLVTVVAVRPSAPGVALANVVGSGIVVTWNGSDTGTPLAYAIAWGTSSGASNLPVQLVPGTTTRLEISAVPAGTYFFRVYAVGASDLSAASPQTSATAGATAAPGPPLGIFGFPGDGTVNARWSAPLIGATPSIYEVQIGTSVGDSSVGSGTTAALSFGFGVGSGSYWMRARAASGGSVGAWSSSVQMPVGGSACSGAPGAPVMLPVTTTSGLVTLTWWPGTGTASGYHVEITPDPGLVPLGTFTTGAGTSFVWSATGGSFTARVVATNGCGSSTSSNRVAFTIQP